MQTAEIELELCEALDTRQRIAARALELVGGTDGFTKSHDPFGLFDMVTEGRQVTWTDSGGRKRSYSGCEDLATRLALEVCELKQGMAWCNRVDGGNIWIPGENLIRIKRRAGYAWHQHRAFDVLRPDVGDAVQIHPDNPHTFILTAVERRDNELASVDTADYGQFLQPSKAMAADHGCRAYKRRTVDVRNGKLHIRGREVIGWLNLLDLRDRELGEPEVEPSVTRTLRLAWPRMQGRDVMFVQERTGATKDGIFGPQTFRMVQRYQAAKGLKVDGIVGPITWAMLKS